MSTMRLARFLARAGVASRRGAIELLDRVRINGRAPTGPGDPIDSDTDTVTLDGRPLTLAAALWVALHKPAGYVTSRAATVRHKTAFSLIRNSPASLVAVGRLDVFSEGLLLLTTDGDAAHRLMHPRWQVTRSYRVEVTGRLPSASRALLDKGVRLADEPRPVKPLAWRFRPAGARGVLELDLAEGRSRVVRRLCTALDLGVRSLVRTGYGPVRLGTLASGQQRSLTARELRAVYGAIGLPVPPDVL